MKKRFQRKIEDFACENCQHKNHGDGYTNHCCFCLYSKHVDINPGDRSAECGSLMEPVAVFKKEEGYVITHKCLKCKYTKNNKAAKGDNFEIILKIAALCGKG